MQFHKLLLTFFFWKKGSGEGCHYDVVKFLAINISKSFSKKVQTSLPPINKGVIHKIVVIVSFKRKACTCIPKSFF